MATPITAALVLFIPQNIFMFEKKLQRIIFAISFIYIPVLFLIHYYELSDEPILVSGKLRKQKTVSTMLGSLFIQALAMYYTNVSNQLFDDIKNYSDEVHNSAKSMEAFFTRTSFDIKNNIQSLIGSLELVLPYITKTEDTLKMSEIASCGCEMLSNLLSNMIDFIMIKSETFSILNTPTNLHEILSKTVKIMKHQAENKGIYLRLTANPGIPQAIEIDSRKLTQVLLNIIGNGIKFTEKGGIDIKIAWKLLEPSFGTEGEESAFNKYFVRNTNDMTQINANFNSSPISPNFTNSAALTRPTFSPSHINNKGNVTIEINDSGLGILNEKFDTIFQPFSHKKFVINNKETGISLYVSKQIIELMGGTISLKSQMGIGSSFTITIPAESCNSHKMHGIISEDEIYEKYMSFLHGKKYFIIDNCEENAFLVAYALKKCCAVPVIAENFDAALLILEDCVNNNFDGIIMDLKIPFISCQEFLEKLKKLEQSQIIRQIPILIFAAEINPFEKVCLSNFGIMNFLQKPYKLSDFLFSLTRLAIKQSHAPRRSILVVDNDTLFVYYLCRLLQGNGHFTMTCGTICEAQNKLLENNGFDIVIIDNLLPDGNGRDLAEFIKNMKKLNRIQIISISANSITEQKKMYEKLEIQAFLQKPLSKKQICSLTNFD